MRKKTKSVLKIIANNRKARFNYFFNEFFEAGIVLKGSEVKSLRDGKANISESYAFDIGGEIFLVNSHIPSYKESSYNNHDPKRNRKLLLNKKEINDKLMPLHKSLFIESSPSPVKYAASLLNLCSDEVRLPLVKVTEETKKIVKSAMVHVNLI